jgi:hypothetical protein
MSVLFGLRKVGRLVIVGGHICLNMLRRVLHAGGRVLWTIHRCLPPRVQVCINLVVIGCSATVMCIVKFVRAVAICLYFLIVCIMLAICTEYKTDD